MKPPLARLAALLSAALVFLICLVPSSAFAETADTYSSYGASAARALGPIELALLIALGFVPAVYMIARARQTR